MKRAIDIRAVFRSRRHAVVLGVLNILLSGCGLWQDATYKTVDDDISGTFRGSLNEDGTQVSYEMSITQIRLCRAGDQILGYNATLTNLDTGQQRQLTCNNLDTYGRFACGDNNKYDATQASYKLTGRMDDGEDRYTGRWSFSSVGFGDQSGGFTFTRQSTSSGRCA